MLKEDGPYGLRRSSIIFATKWVVTAGAVIRGTKWYISFLSLSLSLSIPFSFSDLFLHSVLQQRAEKLLEEGIRADEEEKAMEAVEEKIKVWPLRLIDLRDAEQFDLLCGLLEMSPHTIHYYLTEVFGFVFDIFFLSSSRHFRLSSLLS